MQPIDISVVIMAYNREDFIYKAIESVINQSLDNDRYEIIVLTNFKVPNSYTHVTNIRFVGYTNLTMGEVISLGVEESKGKIISFLDDDDIFSSEKLQKVLDIFNQNPGLIFYHNNYMRFRSRSFPIISLERGDFFSKYELYLNKRLSTPS